MPEKFDAQNSKLFVVFAAAQQPERSMVAITRKPDEYHMWLPPFGCDLARWMPRSMIRLLGRAAVENDPVENVPVGRALVPVGTEQTGKSARPTGTILCLVLLLSGCGPRGPEIAPVTGKVTIDGKSVTSGAIQFWPVSGRPARGQIRADGTYTLTTFDPQDGALLGDHVVTVRCTEVLDEQLEIGSLEEEMEYFSNPQARRVKGSRLRWLVPERYSRRESSGLTATVARGDNNINWELRSKPK